MTADEKLEEILDECLITLIRAFGEREVAREAISFWRKRYRFLFTAALRRNGLDAWETDRLHVLTRVRRLAERAIALADLAGAELITAAHAREASEATDCRPSRYEVSFAGWCIPVPDGAPPPTEAATDVSWMSAIFRPVRAALSGR